MSTSTIDAAARDDRETWDALRREIEDVGISPTVIAEKKPFIVAWFMEAVAAGKIDEDRTQDSNSDGRWSDDLGKTL